MNQNETICETFYTNLRINKALEMSQSELFISLAEEIEQSDVFDPNCKYLVILSFTRYERSSNTNNTEADIYSSTRGYCALGK